MKKTFLIFLVAFLACFANAQMPVFRNQWTTNVPGAYIRGNIILGDALGTFGLLTTGPFTNRGTVYFEGGTTYFLDGIEVQLESTFQQGLNIGGVVWVTNTVYATNFTLTIPQWNDERIPLSALSSPSSTPGFVTLSGGLSCYGFDKASEEQLDFELQLPHGISTNTAYGIDLHLHWTGTTALTAGTSNVVWGLEWAMAKIGENYSATTITNRVTNRLNSVRYHQISDLVRITNGFGESTVIIGRLFRDGGNASDTYDGDAIGLSLDTHYPVIRLGSSNENTDY